MPRVRSTPFVVSVTWWFTRVRNAGTAAYERREPATTAPITATTTALAQRPASLPSAAMAAEPCAGTGACCTRQETAARRGGGGRDAPACRGGGAGMLAGACAPASDGGIGSGGADVPCLGGGSATGRTGGATGPREMATGAVGAAGDETSGATQPSAFSCAGRAGPRSRRGGSGCYGSDDPSSGLASVSPSRKLPQDAQNESCSRPRVPQFLQTIIRRLPGCDGSSGSARSGRHQLLGSGRTWFLTQGEAGSWPPLSVTRGLPSRERAERGRRA